MADRIVPGRRWTNPREQLLEEARRLRAQARVGGTPVSGEGTVPRSAGPAPQQTGWYGPEWMHGVTPEEHERMRARFESMRPRLAGGGRLGAYSGARDFFQGLLPPGGELAPGAGHGYLAAKQHANGQRTASAMSRNGLGETGYGGGGGGGGGSTYYQGQLPYQPEFADPSRQSYPVHRQLMNIYARMFYKTHPIVGMGVDLFSELPWGEVQFVGEGVDGEVRDQYELFWDQTQMRMLLPFITRERTILGEAGPHAFYDDNLGVWSYIGMHNPDQLEVIHSPFIKMEPIVRYMPDQRLRQILNSGSPGLAAVRDSLPPQILSAIASGQAIELHPLNFTYLARKAHPYDVRGTSILSRLWRDLMYEDRIYNTSLAVATRAGAPLKIAKLGDPATGWIPGRESEDQLVGLLANAELDPISWVIYHYGLQVEMVGTQERAWKVEQSGDYIERRLLIGLGISRAFIMGEVSFASAATGLTVFLQRLLAERETVEATWIRPKLLLPLAKMNGWVKPTEAELAHGVRTRRSQRELMDDRRYIIPKLQWARSLDPSVDQAKINAVQTLSQLGVRFSKQYLAALGGADWEEQLEQSATEAEHEAEVIQKYPALAQAGGAGPGGVGDMLPGIPPGDLGFGGPLPGEGDLGLGPPAEGGELGPPSGPEGEPPSPPEAGVHADPSSDGAHPGDRSRAQPSSGGWPDDMVSELVDLYVHQAPPGERLWQDLLKAHPGVMQARDEQEFFEEVREFLDASYPSNATRELEKAFLHGLKRAY